VDETGVTVYSQTPPIEGEAERIKPHAAPGRSPKPAQERLDSMRKQVDDHLEAKEEAAQRRRQEEAETQAKQTNCQTARANLTSLEAAAGRLIRMPDGSYTRLTEDERQQQMAEARRMIAEQCR
jgi:hypothetical protein